jgi:hypothetical protein
MLQNALRDADNLQALLRLKEREKEHAMHVEGTRRLVTKIEMLSSSKFKQIKNNPWLLFR